ncbi:hypothetical protein HDF18_23530 [Mucilaginibacter sp. X5P1]|uniref:hypothetical protein n=1 Tax=Mucilaginibacter sp. X5P1 TaxID=2723088 RepID=UPI0016099C77|nr:hypothetical protein [Mucilaginibacter sp. X5P1]MBB6141307.1 hypothetical protein [Mucilaginibacter sp. X5P1]
MKPFIATEATTFVLIQKVAKNQVGRNASLPHKAFALQTTQNRGCYIFTLLSLRTWPLRFCKNLLCPATLEATIVLPDFIRSCSTDGEKELYLIQLSSKKRTLNEP